MPTYDYRCDACEETVEVMHASSETPSVKCPECRKPMRKCFGAPNIGQAAIPTRKMTAL